MRRWGHRAGIAAVALVLLGVATAWDAWLPGNDDDPGSESFVRRVAVAEPVDLRTMTVMVDSVTGAAAIDEFGSQLISPGLWIVVRYSVTPAKENAGVFFAELRDGTGRVWSSAHGRNQNSCPSGPPGVRSGCVAVFEVPADALPGLRLRLAPGDEQRYGVVADVDLGLDGDDAARFAVMSGLEIPGTTVGGQ